jgi:hypothetical protein
VPAGRRGNRQVCHGPAVDDQTARIQAVSSFRPA